MWKKKKHRPRTLCDIKPAELRKAVNKMCRGLKILPSLSNRYDLYRACEQERQNEIDKRLSLLEA